MATTVNSNVIIYNDLAQTAYLERVQDNISLFNDAAAGAILLADENIVGDFRKRAFYKIGGEITHRNVNSTGKVEDKNISMGEMVGVKVPFKYGPYSITEEAMKRRGRSVDEFSQVVGQDYADALIAGYFAYTSAAVTAAIESNSSAMKVSAPLAVHGKKSLTQGLRKFGDRFERVRLFVMNSATYFDLVDDAIGQKIFGEVDQVIYGGIPGTMGRPVLISDQVRDNTILGLQAGAVQLTTSQLPTFRASPIDDEENLGIRIRAEGTFNLDVLGYSYKIDSGANPNLATVGASANWEKHVSSNKNTAGVIIDVA